jgi:3-isopropylmalate/(R)-2-methylmalate dehydratase small subunit
VDFDTGAINNVTQGKTYSATPFPGFLQELITSGGLMNLAKKMTEGSK